ncbi:MAG: phosphotransferase [Gammaproteobacteria bacterium]|nr:phosphotransferase [Gammaproteobacteria bacterium]
MPERLDELTRWLRAGLDLEHFTLTPASSDASFRRYFRVHHDGQTRIVMDAPPAHEDCRPFVTIARAFLALGLHVPEVLEQDMERGFLLLGDLGTRCYLDALNEDTVERLYGDALDALWRLQSRCDGVTALPLPPYDDALLMREMALFRDWFLERHLEWMPDAEQCAVLERACESLAHSALEQPRVCVHRDFHSRNLMVTETNNPGILDFQDAVHGPITYDLVSLLRDCYIAWPRARVEEWALRYRTRLVHSGLLSGIDEQQFLRWFDWMGMQRHLKAIGIFARLNIRDGKPGYLKDIPRTLGYVVGVSGRYPELAPLHALLCEHVLPRVQGHPA